MTNSSDVDHVEGLQQPKEGELQTTMRPCNDRPTSLPNPRPAPQNGPLINQVSNQWVYEKGPSCDEHLLDQEEREYGFCDLEDETSMPNVVYRKTLGNRRFRMVAVYVLAIFATLFWVWRTFCASPVGLVGGTRGDNADGMFDVARKHHHYRGYDRIRDIDPALIPGGKADSEGKRRLIFVGDIHGCKEELLRLMDKINFDSSRDHLVATGDVVTKGPDNKGVIDELIRLEAVSVRGNHEDSILELASKDVETTQEEPALDISNKHAKLLKHLKKHHLKYLQEMPLIYRIPALPKATAAKHQRKEQDALQEEILVVHAGLVPAVPLELQDPYYTMNMRSINHKSHVPSVERAHGSGPKKPWRKVWNWYNDRLHEGRLIQDVLGVEEDSRWLSALVGKLGGSAALRRKGPKPKPQVVVYGHDSHAGLQIHRWSKGLDSACVAGGKLTAMILDAEGKVELESVKCKNYK
ncbi:hypothetical protein MBLNU230_g7976t1 [Neophaeotheca triangularis]